MIVAFCRDYDKAYRVFYDDYMITQNQPTMIRHRQQQRGPQLQIIKGNIITPNDVTITTRRTRRRTAKTTNTNHGWINNKKKRKWLLRALLSSSLTSSPIYDDGDDDANKTNRNKDKDDDKTITNTTDSSNKDHDDNRRRRRQQHLIASLSSSSEEDDDDEALREAISGCTAIIQCIGSVRMTNLWTDIIVRPIIRLLNKNVTSWCHDLRHPYYTHYLCTQKIVQYAEQEQQQREAAAATTTSIETPSNRWNHDPINKNTKQQQDKQQEQQNVEGPPRIRFIRISDLCLSQRPWSVVPILINTIRSMVFRYQDMAEQVLEESTYLDSIVIRSGDMINDERLTTNDDNNDDDSGGGVKLQVDVPENIPHPTVVGRDDVAALAVASTLLPSHQFTQQQQQQPTDPSTMSINRLRLYHHRQRRRRRNKANYLLAPSVSPPYHCRLGLRWVGNATMMKPYPGQGQAQGHANNAHEGLVNVLHKYHEKQEEVVEKNNNNNNKALVMLKKITNDKKGDSTITTTSSSNTTNNNDDSTSWPPQLTRRKLKPYGVWVALYVYLFIVIVMKAMIQHLSWLLLKLIGVDVVRMFQQKYFHSIVRMVQYIVQCGIHVVNQ